MREPWWRTGSRWLSGGHATLAVASAALILIEPLWPAWLSGWGLESLKSAIPLILVGLALAFLQVGLSRTRGQIALGLMGSTAFVLWGAEQYMTDAAMAARVDAVVVFLFVLDVGCVIFGQLRRKDA